MVAKGEDLTFDANQFEVVCSTECFEHALRWPDIFNNMVRMSNVSRRSLLALQPVVQNTEPTAATLGIRRTRLATDYANVTEADVRD